jgi:hypothetical protein
MHKNILISNLGPRLCLDSVIEHILYSSPIIGMKYILTHDDTEYRIEIDSLILSRTLPFEG